MDPNFWRTKIWLIISAQKFLKMSQKWRFWTELFLNNEHRTISIITELFQLTFTYLKRWTYFTITALEGARLICVILWSHWPILANILFLYPLKTLENLCFWSYRNGTLGYNGWLYFWKSIAFVSSYTDVLLFYRDFWPFRRSDE